MSTILVTGTAGFIGSHVAGRLLDMGHQVIGVDLFSDYYNTAFKEDNVAALRERDDFTLVHSDVSNAGAMNQLFEQNDIDWVIHLAAQAGVRVSVEQPLVAEEMNIKGTYVVLEAARTHNVHNVIFASSSSVYGNVTEIPFREDMQLDHPISPYAATKRSCELIAATYHQLYGMNCIGLRFFTVYGERGRPDMAPYLFTEMLLNEKPLTLFGDGSAERDFTYIDDIVDGIIACVGKELGYEIINLGHSEPIAMRDYIALLETITGKEAHIEFLPERPGDMPKTYADISKAKNILDWEPTTSLEDGLTRFVQWFKEHRQDNPF